MSILQTTPSTAHTTTILPLNLTTPFFGPAPLSLTRFHSLISPTSPTTPQQDDYFSHDLPAPILKKTFGQISQRSLLNPALNPGTPQLLALLSSSDEAMAPSISKADLISKWGEAMQGTTTRLHVQSGEIAHGTHGLEGDDGRGSWAREVDFPERVLKYLADVVGGVDEVAWRVWRERRRQIEEVMWRERMEGEEVSTGGGGNGAGTGGEGKDVKL